MMTKLKLAGVNKVPTTPTSPTSRALLNMPLRSILFYMQQKRLDQFSKQVKSQDQEETMYSSKIHCFPPFDPLSKIQMGVFGGLFSVEYKKHTKEENMRSIDSKHSPLPMFGSYDQEVKSLTYPLPIGPLTFLASTIPPPVDPVALRHLEKCAKRD